MPRQCEVAIIGAGAAGLTAAATLIRNGIDARCLEAGDRPGGRIRSIRDPRSPVPIELGAEFGHGRSPDLWSVLNDASLKTVEQSSRSVAMDSGRVLPRCEPGESIDHVMDAIKEQSAPGFDESFAAFLRRSAFPEKTKQWAAAYVEGFNAADASRISVASLAEEARAGDAIERDRSFRVLDGYDALAHHLAGSLIGGRLQLNAVVTRIEWEAGAAKVHYRATKDGVREILSCRRVIVTVPLGVLQANDNSRGSIVFDPAPDGVLEAARSLAFGNVLRITLRFENPFWEAHPDLAQTGFLFSQEPVFPTWWTTRPVQSPLLTGWSAGPAARPLLAMSDVDIAGEAMASLRRITGLRPSRLEAAYFHDWNRDPFFRGAYSYIPAGALPARRMLAEPSGDTLFFAGEATDLTGNSGTVHGAIASGKRAAAQVLSSLRSETAFLAAELQLEAP
jgi:monoamine oxidase